MGNILPLVEGGSGVLNPGKLYEWRGGDRIQFVYADWGTVEEPIEFSQQIQDGDIFVVLKLRRLAALVLTKHGLVGIVDVSKEHEWVQR